MNFLEKLSSIVKVKFDLSKLKDFKINVFSNNKIEHKVYNDNHTVHINLAGLSADEMPQVLELLKKAVQEENMLLIEEKASETIQDIKTVEKKPENVAIVEYFTGKIKLLDLEILRASLYIKELHERGDPVGQLKDDIVARYGSRGRNISNLCTAGYFATELKPLYELMKQMPDFTTDKYQEAFNKIVNTFPFAIFVSIKMSKEQVLEEVKGKMQMNKGYGINHMNIHGIGESNVSKIFWVLKQIESLQTSPPEMESKRNYITVTIFF